MALRYEGDEKRNFRQRKLRADADARTTVPRSGQS